MVLNLSGSGTAVSIPQRFCEMIPKHLVPYSIPTHSAATLRVVNDVNMYMCIVQGGSSDHAAPGGVTEFNVVIVSHLTSVCGAVIVRDRIHRGEQYTDFQLVI